MKSKMRIATVLCFVFSIALVPGLNSQDDVAANITKMIQEGVKADLAGDSSYIKNNSVDGYVEGTSFGTWMTKDQLMDTSKNKLNKADVSDIKVNVFGDTAIARFRESYDGMVDGEHRSRSIICTQTWGKQGDAWKTLASHCSQTK